MKVLIVSHLFADIASGPSWSVPSYADSLSKIDDVKWINTIEETLPHWEKVTCFHKLSEYGKLKLSTIYKGSEYPDIVVFQGFNFLEQCLFAIELRCKRIPYVIVPRGSLAYDAIHNHAWLKKWIAHKLILNRFVKQAAAIQYLTREEKEESGDKWNRNYFILGNGFSNESIKDSFSKDCIKGLFIGRLDMHHKGIDNLLEAADSIADIMREARFSIDFYGPDRFDSGKIRSIIQTKQLSDILKVHGPITGEEKKHILMDSDVFFLTSRFEGHPMGLIEALSYGIPAVVTAGSNMMEKILECDAGWGADPNTVTNIASCIKQVINERSKLKEKGQNARELSKEYDWKALSLKLHNELSNIINNTIS